MKKIEKWECIGIAIDFDYWLSKFWYRGRWGLSKKEHLCNDYIEDCCNYILRHPELLPSPHIVPEEDENFEDFEEFYHEYLRGHCENKDNEEECEKYMDAEQNLVRRVLFEVRPYESAEGFYGEKIWKYFLIFWEEERRKAENEKEAMEREKEEDEENDEDYEESPYLLYNDQINTEEFQNAVLSEIWKKIDYFEEWEGSSCCVTEPIYNCIRQETSKKLKEEKNNVVCDNKGL